MLIYHADCIAKLDDTRRELLLSYVFIRDGKFEPLDPAAVGEGTGKVIRPAYHGHKWRWLLGEHPSCYLLHHFRFKTVEAVVGKRLTGIALALSPLE